MRRLEVRESGPSFCALLSEKSSSYTRLRWVLQRVLSEALQLQQVSKDNYLQLLYCCYL